MLMIPFLITPIYSLLLFVMIIFRKFDSKWDGILSSMTKIPTDDVLESLYKLRIRESDQLKNVLELYDMENHQKISMPKYQKLKTMVKRSIDQKLRLRNFDARNERIETGAVVTSRRGSSGRRLLSVESKRAVFERRPIQVSGTTVMSVQKPTPKTAPPSEPPTPRGRSASRKREPQRQESIWEDESTAVQRLLERYLH